MTSLFQHSVDTLINLQSPSGTFPASPNFPTYQYCWFRDGSFISYALDLAGYPEKADLFHRWCANTVLLHAEKIQKRIKSANQNSEKTEDMFFHCRFSDDGSEVLGHWGNHQLDGLGTWLWSLEQHINESKKPPLPSTFHKSADLIANYLLCSWNFPCSDCWEENESGIHFSTLTAVYAGLMSHWKMRKKLRSFIGAIRIKRFLINEIKRIGYLTKSQGKLEVDASLLWAAVPYNLVKPDSQAFIETLRRIEKDLKTPEGGIHRYVEDTYYGGGEWLLLSAWYGWVK